MGVGFFFNSIGVALGKIIWYQPADCLVVITEYSTARVAVVEMSNAQSLFGLSVLCLYACVVC